MPKRIYQLGEPCDVCGTPTIQGSKGNYCKPCYIAWKNQADKQPRVAQTYQPQPVYANPAFKASLGSNIAPQTTINPIQEAQERKNGMIKDAQERKDRSIDKSRSISGAYNIISALIQSGMIQEVDIKPKLLEYTKYLFSLDYDESIGWHDELF